MLTPANCCSQPRSPAAMESGGSGSLAVAEASWPSGDLVRVKWSGDSNWPGDTWGTKWVLQTALGCERTGSDKRQICRLSCRIKLSFRKINGNCRKCTHRTRATSDKILNFYNFMCIIATSDNFVACRSRCRSLCVHTLRSDEKHAWYWRPGQIAITYRIEIWNWNIYTKCS